MGLDSKFMKLPRGEHTDFSDPNAAKMALRRWSNEGRDMHYGDGITLAPGETALGFTESIDHVAASASAKRRRYHARMVGKPYHSQSQSEIVERSQLHHEP